MGKMIDAETRAAMHDMMEGSIFFEEESLADSFNEEKAVAQLLAGGVLFVNSRRILCLNGTPREETLVLFINCSDLFWWACADAESLPLEDVPTVWQAWESEGSRGVDRWVCLRRGMRPQAVIEREWRKCGFWDSELESLPAR